MKPTTNWSRFVLRIAVLILGAMTVSPARAQKWTEELSAAPIARGFTTAVLDSQTNRMVIFGGGGPSMDLNDVWVLIDATGPIGGATWLQLQPTGSAPAPRTFPTSIYDQVSNRMTIFGGGEGSSSPCVNDVWVLEHANGLGGTPDWLPLSPSGTPPSPRGALSSIFDSNTDRMTIFGGQNCFSTNFNDVWVLTQANGVGGTPTWIQLTPAGTPPSPRSNPGGVGYDPA